MIRGKNCARSPDINIPTKWSRPEALRAPRRVPAPAQTRPTKPTPSMDQRTGGEPKPQHCFGTASLRHKKRSSSWPTDIHSSRDDHVMRARARTLCTVTAECSREAANDVALKTETCLNHASRNIDRKRSKRTWFWFRYANSNIQGVKSKTLIGITV